MSKDKNNLKEKFSKAGERSALNIARVRLSLKELEKIKRIAWLQGVTEYTIWADCVPNGDEICDKYQEELERLLSNEA